MAVNFLGLRLPSSADELGANLHKNSVDAGAALINRGQQIYNLPLNSLSGIGEFLHGAVTGQPRVAQLGEQRQGSVTVALPTLAAAQAAPKAAAPKAAKQGDASAAANPAKKGGGKATDINDPSGLLAQIAAAQGGQISLRQAMAVGDYNGRTVPRTSPKPLDESMALLEKFNMDQLQRGMTAAGNDPGKQAAVWQQFKNDTLEARKVLSPGDMLLQDYMNRAQGGE
jgi:hypothetical protein